MEIRQGDSRCLTPSTKSADCSTSDSARDAVRSTTSGATPARTTPRASPSREHAKRGAPACPTCETSGSRSGATCAVERTRRTPNDESDEPDDRGLSRDGAMRRQPVLATGKRHCRRVQLDRQPNEPGTGGVRMPNDDRCEPPGDCQIRERPQPFDDRRGVGKRERHRRPRANPLLP